MADELTAAIRSDGVWHMCDYCVLEACCDEAQKVTLCPYTNGSEPPKL